MLKRYIALLLVVTLAFSVIPVFAEETVYTDDVIQEQQSTEITDKPEKTELKKYQGSLDDYIPPWELRENSEPSDRGEDQEGFDKNTIPQGTMTVGKENAEGETDEPVPAVRSLSSTDFEAISNPSFRNGVRNPHMDGRGGMEYVSPYDGNLQLSYTDISLPGRNGLDLNLGRFFSNEHADVERTNTGGNYTIAPTTYFNRRYALGIGWSFAFPSVELRKKYDGTYQAYYHDGSGRAYRSNYKDSIKNEAGEDYYNGYLIYGTNLDNCYTDNVRFKEKDRTYTRNGTRSEYSFKRPDNTMEYFAEDGRLLAIKDRFGNEIKFDYTNITGENIIPFYSYNDFTTEEYWTAVSNRLIFDGGSTRRTSEAESYYVDLDDFCNEYYVSILYEAKDDNINPYKGTLEVYCDLYSEDSDLLESIFIGSATPEDYDVMHKIEGSFSIDDYDFYDIPVKAKLRIKAVSSKYKIHVEDIRLSPKIPLITKITDTIGRTLEFAYDGDLYERYEEDPTFMICVDVKDPSGEEITKIEYYRYLYNQTVNDEYDNRAENHYFYLLGGWYANGYFSYINYDYMDGAGSSIYGNEKVGMYYNFKARPMIKEVKHRNSKTCFEHEIVRRWIDNRPAGSTAKATQYNTGFIDSCRVIKKYDVNDSAGDTEGEPYNIYTYDYTSGSYTDNTAYNFYRHPHIDTVPSFINPEGGSYIVTVTNPNGRIDKYQYTGHEFDEGFRLKWSITLNLLDKETSLESSISDSDSVIREYTYGDNYALISPTLTKTTEKVSGTSRVYYNKTVYDAGSSLPVVETLPLTEAEAEEEEIPEEKAITTDYKSLSNRMYVPELRTYYQSENGSLLEERYDIDSLGRITSKTDAKGNVTNYEYNSSYPWLVSRAYVADPEANGDTQRTSETVYEYTDGYALGPNRVSVKTSDGAYSTDTYEYELKYGNVSRHTDSVGNVTEYKFDMWNRPTYVYYPSYSSETGLKYPYTYFHYNNFAIWDNMYTYRQTKHVYVSSNPTYDSASEVTKDETYYDDFGNLVYANTARGEEQYIYDNAMRLTGYQNQADYGTLSNTMSFGYDGFDRVTSYTDRLGNTQNAEYKSLSTEYSFTPAGSTTKENHYVENYDMHGNKISEQIYPQGKSSSPLTTYYEYDLAGNLVKTTDANGRTTKMSYDELNNPVEIVMPDGNKISYDYTVWNSVKKTTQGDGDDKYSILETYDDRGLSVSHRQLGLDVRTKPWYYSYRSDGLLEKAIAPDGTEHSYLYDNSGNNTLYTAGALSDEKAYNHFGQVDKITRSESGVQSGSTDYIYDSAKGWLTSKVTSLGTTNYSYNATGNVVGVTSPNGLTRTYTRDAADRLTGVTADEKTFAYEYYGDGLIKSITYPGGNIVTSFTYDNANRLTQLETKNKNDVLKSYLYKYDSVGNIISVSGSESAVYTYDELNRLKTATENGYTATYEYDSRNNLIRETRDDGYVKTYEYSGDNRLVKSTENGTDTLYEYDLNGNLIKRGEDEFAYDSNDNLVYSRVNGVETTYEIGQDGLRKSKTTNGITTTYSIDENGNVITEGDDEIIIGNVPLAKKIDGEYFYYIYNAHGDVVMIVDETGNIKNTYRYDAWGTVVSETETIRNSHKYAGEYFDAETGLIYLRARYYDPSIRRFISEDKHWNTQNRVYGDKEYAEGETKIPDITSIAQANNLYVYALNNPVKYVDPSGGIVIAGFAISSGTVALVGGIIALVGLMSQQEFWDNLYIGINSLGKSIGDAIIYAKGKMKAPVPPSKLKKGDNKVKTPNKDGSEFKSNKDGSYTHKKTGWTAKKDPSGHRGDHWDMSPPNGKGHINVDFDGNII